MFTITADRYDGGVHPRYFIMHIQARDGTSTHTFTVPDPYMYTYSEWRRLATTSQCSFVVGCCSSIEKAGGRIKFVSAAGGDSKQVAEYDVDNFDSALLATTGDLRARGLLIG